MFAAHVASRHRIASALATLALALVPGTGCKAPPGAAEVSEATLFFPPLYRYVEEPRFCFSEAERRRALAEYRKGGADTLFELVVDDAGTVVKARLVRTHIDEIYHGDVLEFARAFAFSADERSGMYRAFYYPLAYSLRHEFEWQ